MILKASQRGGASQLAAHLLNADSNDHVEIYEISGFAADTLEGALHEAYAASRATQCQQYLFSVSLNPPQHESVSVEVFEHAIAEIERTTGLSGQPRVLVFHEKEGRRHAHCVWSRIKPDEMKAVNLPYFKRKLCDISRQLYQDYGWNMPDGLHDPAKRDPLNYSREECQQAQRTTQDPKEIKRLLQDAWHNSDNKEAFQHALCSSGFALACGDKRGYVAVDADGEVYSLSRWVGVKAKELKARLGAPDTLPTIKEAKATFEPVALDGSASLRASPNNAKQALREQHRAERKRLRELHAKRWQEETATRAARMPSGLKGIWFKITGRYQKVREQNELETESCRMRDRDEMQALIDRQLGERKHACDNALCSKARIIYQVGNNLSIF